MQGNRSIENAKTGAISMVIWELGHMINLLKMAGTWKSEAVK
jgi:hypothetical protein